jgi:16S rRNA (guanine527-N7)-methyltransferase
VGRAGTPNSADRLAADREAALRLVHVSRETLGRLDSFVGLLLKWQRKLNLIGRGSENHIWSRHIADCLQLLDVAPHARVWIDLGSGAGFPGLVIACALAGTAGAQVHLVESNLRKAAFLRESARVLQLPALVHAVRIEDFVSRFADSADVVTARALAPLSHLFAYAAPLVEKGAQALFLKGQDVEAELTDAAKSWKIVSQLLPSRTSNAGFIVKVAELAPLPP